MKVNRWTLGLASAGLVSLPVLGLAEEKMAALGTALSSTVISGYVNTSAQWDLGTGNAGAPGHSFNAGKQDGFNLNAVNVRLQKPLDEGQWSAGYTVDFFVGPDAATLATGAGVSQAYIALRAPVGNGLDVKFGVWDTIIGYETYHAGNNPNFTRSYGFTIEPTTHTGLHVGYQFNSVVSASVCVANTFGPGINARPTGATAAFNESYKTYMGMISLTAPESWGWAAGSTLSAAVMNGFNGLAGGSANATHWYLGGTLNTPVQGLKAGIAYDYVGYHRNSSALPAPLPPGSSAHRWAAAFYTSYQATEKLSLHSRAEYFAQSAGLAAVAVPGVGSLPPDVIAFTLTVQYDLWQNVLSRLELRWDHDASKLADNGGIKPYGNGSFAGGGKKDNVMIAANLIYKF
jgi:hypothetical protein